METKEKILAIQKLLEDNRGSFGIDNRSKKALELSQELKLENWEYADIFIDSITDFRNGDCEGDGRYFRTNYKNGGYELMDELHGLNSNTLKDKSDDFKKIMELCDYPNFRFDDMED